MALTLIGALILVFLRSYVVAPNAMSEMIVTGNDNILRLMSVRDWLGGQSWFDMSNHRVLPPEGLSLHWSRYVDLGIAGMIALLSLVMPYDQAEALTVVAWPALILVSFLTLSLVMTLRLFGPRAATVAILAIVMWRLIAYNYIGPLQLDHHGLQILLLTIVVYTLAIDGPELRRGIIGGGTAALSLAVGLENLLPIAAAGVILMVQAVASGDQGRRQMQAFGLSLLAFAVPLHIGQTPRAEWLVAHCDELGPPVLGLLSIAAVSTLVVGAVIARGTGLRGRISVAIGTAVLAAGGGAFVMQACPNFPYGNLPDDVREAINAWIIEALPAQHFFANGNSLAFSHALPIFVTTGVASLIGLWRWRSGQADAHEPRAVAILLVFALIGLLGSLAQIRIAVLAAPVVPVLIGYCTVCLLDMRAQVARPAVVSLAALAFIGSALLPGQLHLAYLLVSSAHAAEGTGPSTARLQRNSCREPEIIESLNDLPQGRVLAPISLGPSILFATDHILTSVPYHRSAEALGNGILPFVGDETQFNAAVERADPHYVIMCKGGAYGDGAAYVNIFANGALVDGFEAMDGFDDTLIVLRVIQ